MSAAPLADRILGRLSAKLLVVLAVRAKKRGDMHEYEHCVAGLLAGNSGHDRWPCTLEHHRASIRELDEFRALWASGVPTEER